jgi:hypothetical protein
MEDSEPHEGHRTEARSVRFDRAPLVVSLSEEEAVVLPRSSWERLKKRVLEAPQTSTLWLGLAGVLAGATIAERDSTLAIATGLGALLCCLAHRAVNRANSKARKDIVDEMRLHEARRRRPPML